MTTRVASSDETGPTPGPDTFGPTDGSRHERTAMGLELLLPLMIIALVALMFLQSSKQRKAMKELQEMQASLSVGDQVLTTSGLHATVVTVGEETLVLEIAPGVRTQWDRRVIREKLDPGTTPGSAPGSTTGEDGADSGRGATGE